MNGGGPARARRIGDNDEPNLFGNRAGIRPPPIENNNFEIKSSLISMVQGNKFHGLPMEDPLDHLDQFDLLCSTVKMNGVSEDAFKLRLFPFSLGDKARHWEKGLPQGSVTSWEACKKMFLDKFFSHSRTSKLRNEISSFMQKNNENFNEAWERFKGYISRCPHHGFTDESLLSTLYRGASPKYRMSLDTASNGNFLGQETDKGMTLVENLAQSDGSYGDDYDRSSRNYGDGEDKYRKEMSALNDKMDKVLRASQRTVNYVGDRNEPSGDQGTEDDIYEENPAEINYVGNQGNYNRGNYNQGFRNYNNQGNNNLSYRSNNVENPQDQYYPPQQRSQGNQGNYQAPFRSDNQGNQGNPQQKPFFPNNKPIYNQGNQGGSSNQPIKVDETTRLLHKILEGQSNQGAELSNLKREMDSLRRDSNQDAQNASSSKRPMANLPGKCEPNPREHVNSVSLGKEQSASSERRVWPRLELYEIEKEYLRFDAQGVAIGTRSKVLAEKKEREELLARKEKEESEKKKKGDDHVPILCREPPFPGYFKQQILAECNRKRAEFEEKLLEAKDPVDMMESWLLDEDISDKTRVLVMEKVEVWRDKYGSTVETSMSITAQSSLPEEVEDSYVKLEDPGTFTLPCTVGPLTFPDCLCDLGASVNVMPLSTAQKLGCGNFKECKVSLVMADYSTKQTEGKLEDVPLGIEGEEIQTDFVILDIAEAPRDTLILGRPFLATAGAVIDVRNGKIDLHLGRRVLRFKMNKARERCVPHCDAAGSRNELRSTMPTKVKKGKEKPREQGQTSHVENLAWVKKTPPIKEALRGIPRSNSEMDDAVKLSEKDAKWQSFYLERIAQYDELIRLLDKELINTVKNNPPDPKDQEPHHVPAPTSRHA